MILAVMFTIGAVLGVAGTIVYAVAVNMAEDGGYDG